MPAAQDRARRMIGVGRAGHVRLVLLLPGIADAVSSRDLVDRVVQPGMPFRGHLRPLRLAVIHDPALFAAGAPTAAPQRPGTLLAIVPVAEIVGSDQLAPEPGQQSRAERHRSIRALRRFLRVRVYGDGVARSIEVILSICCRRTRADPLYCVALGCPASGEGEAAAHATPGERNAHHASVYDGRSGSLRDGTIPDRDQRDP